MADCTIVFAPLETTVTVPTGTTLLEAAGKAGISIDSVCGGDGICARCKMIVTQGEVGGDATALLTREEIRRGVVLACQSTVQSDLNVEIPQETRAVEKVVIDEDAQRFRALGAGIEERAFAKSPITSRVLLKMDPPTLENNLADCQRIRTHLEKLAGVSSVQTGLKVIQRMPRILRDSNYTVTATIGRRRGVAELMDIEPGDTSAKNVIAVVDVGTSTIVVHLVDSATTETIGAEACFNSQATYGREVTARMIAAEKRGPQRLQHLLVEDINSLISALAAARGVNPRDITAVVCAGNTAMTHFLLGLPTDNIRREPYIAVTTEPPPFRAAEVGIKINPRGLLFTVPGIGGWVGGDLAAGILATGMHDMDGIGMLIDVGTNGEVIIGNSEWLIACSASAGPCLEGAGVKCGMMATRGAIEKVYLDGKDIRYDVIGGGKPDGICGSGIIDVIAVMLKKGIIDRAGKLIKASDPGLHFKKEHGRFELASKRETLRGRPVCIFQEDIDNIVTAKAAIFAAAKIMLDRLDLKFSDVSTLMIAGGFGSYISLESATAIGLLPDLPGAKTLYVGNTSIWGAKLAALSGEAREALRNIVARTTYYDLMGTDDYVDQFKQAMFLPHTNIELFPSATTPTDPATEAS
ncbi:MAG: DUF4445 domain-containing protein [Phycisphaerae bacterium]|nr:DUF4445 domain-containing protein [Planctomycetota bacterium]MBL7221823.1 DUF4445 domain-containing protein [Phycisphaerae bacterium]